MAVCVTFYSVVTGKTAVEKRYRTEPVKANTIDDFYNRMNIVRSRHGLGSIGKPSLVGTAALASSINSLYSSISSTGTSIGIAMPYGVSVAARNPIAGISASYLEKDIAALEKKCIHNATNRSPNVRACVNNNSAFFSPVYATVFNPAAFQSLSLPKVTARKQEVKLSSIDAAIRMNSVMAGIQSAAAPRASFTNDRSWFTAHSGGGGNCPDDSRNNASNFSGNNGGFFSRDFGDRSHDGSDFGDFSNFSDFGANFGVVGSVYKCALNNVNNFANDNNANFVAFNSSFCPTNYSPYTVEGIDF